MELHFFGGTLRGGVPLAGGEGGGDLVEVVGADLGLMPGCTGQKLKVRHFAAPYSSSVT